MGAIAAEQVAEALADPFDPSEVKWKPQAISGNRAMVIAFVDARVVQDRLDDVLGVMNWQDSYECLPDGSVVCRLKIRVGEDWICKEDVGGQSEQPDEGDRRKAAFSDALKRAAVKFGIGRYLYRLKAQWMDYDPQKRQIIGTPRLPADAMPKPPPPAAKPDSAKGPGLPQTGEELHRRLADKDRLLAEQGVCKPGDLVRHVVEAGVKKGLEKDLAKWTGKAIQLAIEETKAFESARRGAPPAAAAPAAPAAAVPAKGEEAKGQGRASKKEQASALILRQLVQRADACKSVAEVRDLLAEGQALRGTLSEADLEALNDRCRLANARIKEKAAERETISKHGGG